MEFSSFTATSGTLFKLSSVVAPSGYDFDGWYLIPAEGSWQKAAVGNLFAMPAYNLTLHAQYTEYAPAPTPTPVPTPMLYTASFDVSALGRDLPPAERPSPITQTNAGQAITLPTFSGYARDLYDWYDGNILISGDTLIPSGNATLVLKLKNT